MDSQTRVNWRAEDNQASESVEEKLAKVDFHDMKERNPNLTKFTFDKKRGQWCEIELEVSHHSARLIKVSLESWQDFDGECRREGLSFLCCP